MKKYLLLSLVLALSLVSDASQIDPKFLGPVPTSSIGQSGATNGQVLQWNGSAWAPATPSGGGGTWGSITGTLSSQTDLQTALDGKASKASNLSDLASISTARNNILPSQTGNSGKYLQTDGTNATWEALSGSGITSLNSLSGATQTFATGTSGTDFGISSVGTTHTFNIPTASGTNRGALSSADWTTFNGKLAAGQILRGADGSVSTPGIRLTTDDDTGLYQVGDGNLSVTANGTANTEFNQNNTTFKRQVIMESTLDVTGNITAGNYPPTGSNNAIAKYDGSGNLASAANQTFNTFGGITDSSNLTWDNRGAGQIYHNSYHAFRPLQISNSESWNIYNHMAEVDPDKDGFSMASGAQWGNFSNYYFKHFGTSDIGQFTFFNAGADLGDGTDGFDVNGLRGLSIFFNLEKDVNVTNQILGVDFAINMDPDVTTTNGVFPFRDSSNMQTTINGYEGLSISPQIAGIQNNNGFTGVNINPNVTEMVGNSNVNGVFAGGTYSGFGTGGYNGINVNPTITDVQYVNGVFVSLDSVTVKPGVQSEISIQGLTITFIAPGDNDNITVELIDDQTAGSETASLVGNAIEIHIEAGVSTVNQVKAAIEANPTLTAALTVTLDVAPSTPANADGPTNFSGGESPGSKTAGYFDGDVEITGDLNFGGDLAIGKLNAFHGQNVANGGGNPTAIHQLISSLTVPDDDTTANADTMGVNTAMLVSIGEDAAPTLGAFGLFTALGLPAVVETKTGSTIPRIQGAVFAISLSPGSTGGTIEQVEGVRSVLIPNGITTVDRSIGALIESPFGTIGTENFGVYQTDAERNFFEGTVESEKGLQLKTNGSQPTCSASTRGMFWNIEGGAGVADVLQICQKNSSDNYVWVTL